MWGPRSTVMTMSSCWGHGRYSRLNRSTSLTINKNNNRNRISIKNNNNNNILIISNNVNRIRKKCFL